VHDDLNIKFLSFFLGGGGGVGVEHGNIRVYSRARIVNGYELLTRI